MKKLHKSIALGILILFYAIGLQGQNTIVSILPKPLNLQIEKGIFKITDKTNIIVANENTRKDAEIFNQYLSQYYGISLPVSINSKADKHSIIIKDISTEILPDDAYRMHITPDSILIEGKGAGVFYALQSLRQLMPAKKMTSLDVPCLKIYDYPQYSWRGMHLDVCRHFYTIAEVKKYIDMITFYKMNVFHWHLTDDQGWRIMIDKYPKLTSVGGY